MSIIDKDWAVVKSRDGIVDNNHFLLRPRYLEAVDVKLIIV